MGKGQKQCSLCGGKLRDGICTECGMDNRKCDDMYAGMLNKGEYQVQEPGEREARESEKRTEKKEKPAANKVQIQQQLYKPTGQRTGPYASVGPYAAKGKSSANRKANKGRRGLIGFFVVMFVLIVVLVIVGIRESPSYPGSDLSKEFNEVYEDNENYDDSYDDFMEKYDPYAHIEEQLSPIGDTWEMALPAGLYVVGTDIPEGEYVLTGGEGSSCVIRDEYHSVFTSHSFGTEEYSVEFAEGQKLFSGALISITGMNPVVFSTSNAQTDDMTAKMANPLTESLEMEAGTELIAGQDFPAGVYDIEITDPDFGILEMTLEVDELPLLLDSVLLMEKNPTQENPTYFSSYKNMILPEGTKLAADVCVKLVPSSEIPGEDYMGFYEIRIEDEGQK